MFNSAVTYLVVNRVAYKAMSLIDQAGFQINYGKSGVFTHKDRPKIQDIELGKKLLWTENFVETLEGCFVTV